MGDETTLNELLSQWQREMECGRDTPVVELCRDRPDLAGELERRIKAMRQMRDLQRASQPTADTLNQVQTDTSARELPNAEDPYATRGVPADAPRQAAGSVKPGYDGNGLLMVLRDLLRCQPR